MRKTKLDPSDLLDTFDIAADVIKFVYPDIYNKGRGWWGAQRIPNYGILLGAIERAIREDRKRKGRK